jgi:carbonic anhydrase/acetyltransferase-like protein (isoleucine patch superfamily)
MTVKPKRQQPGLMEKLKIPDIAPGVFIAPTASVYGDVTIAPDCSIWFGVVIRAEAEPIFIGARTNIQDGAILHVDSGYPVTISHDVTVGHKAVVHGATIESGCLIGIGAIVLNGAVIGENSLVAAGALVLENRVFPPKSLIMGSPAKRVGDVTDEQLLRIQQGVGHYVEAGRIYLIAEAGDS